MEIFRVERIENTMVAKRDRHGTYTALSAEDLEGALTTGKYKGEILVRMERGARWYPLRVKRFKRELY